MKLIIKICLTVLVAGIAGRVSGQQHRTQAQQDTLKKYYVRLLKSGKISDQKKLDRDLIRLSNTRNEQDLIIAIQLYDLKKKGSAADSLVEVAVKRFPKGEMAMVSAYNKIVETNGSSAQKIVLYNHFITEFPEPAVKPDIAYDYARSEVASAFATENNAKDNQQWIDKIKTVTYKGICEESDAKIFLNHKDTVTAEHLLRASVTHFSNFSANPDPGSKANYYSSVAALANLLYARHNYEEAMAYAKIAYDGDKNSPENIASYALALSANGKASEGLLMLGDLISNGKANQGIYDNLKTVYVKSKGSDDGFDAYLQKLGDERRKKIEASISGKASNEVAPDFTLKDMGGNIISLADLKGKTIILDFWATWCGPCKKSFPAMQMALNKYKDDPNVRFLFIDTWERIPDPKKDVQDFIAANKYSFQVLLDDKPANVVGKYGISGIPAKFVIDGKGIIRFKLTGFEGDNAAAVDELSAMIELARKDS